MAAPTYSPGPGQPTTYTDANGASYVYDRNSGFWQQMSGDLVKTGGDGGGGGNGGGGSAGSSGALDINSPDFWNQLNQLYNTPSTTAAPNYPAGVWDVTSPDVFIKQAINELTPYYTQLLKEADGDINLAKQRLEEDYQKGIRVAKEDLESNLASLGITFTTEADNMRQNLNKRGIALTQTTPGVAGRMTYAGEGQPKTELAQLTESQRLRKEAEDRTAQRALETAGITKQRGTENVTRQDQLYREELQRQKEEQAVGRAQVYSSAETAQKNAQIAKAQAEATTPSSSSSTSDAYNVPGGDYMAAYKARGWTNEAAIRGDARARGLIA